jgi:hypothetical protein
MAARRSELEERCAGTAGLLLGHKGAAAAAGMEAAGSGNGETAAAAASGSGLSVNSKRGG